MKESKVFAEFPKYIQLPDGYKIVINKEEEDEITKGVNPDESTGKNNGKGVNKKKSDTNRGTGAGGESDEC